MMGRSRQHRWIGFTLLLLLLCCSHSDECDEALEWACLERMGDEIRALRGDPLCSDSTECRFIAFGSKPCGGPWRYLIYSVSTVDTVELARRVAEYNEFEWVLNRRYARGSDCRIVSQPVLGCRDGRCVDLRYGP